MPARQAHDPLRGVSWQRGIEPQQEPPEQQQEQGQEIDPHSADWMLQCRAVRIVRQRYGISPSDMSRWTARHDKEALRVLQALKQGKPVERHIHQEPPPINPLEWSRYW